MLLSLSLLALNGCQDDDNNNDSNDNKPINIQFETVMKSSFSGAFYGNGGGNDVIDSEADWADFYKVYTDGKNTKSPLDYTQSTAIAVVDKLYPDLGHTITINAVVKRNDSMFVTFEKLNNVESNALTMMEQPYHIIKIPKTTLPITFIEQ